MAAILLAAIRFLDSVIIARPKALHSRTMP